MRRPIASMTVLGTSRKTSIIVILLARAKVSWPFFLTHFVGQFLLCLAPRSLCFLQGLSPAVSRIEPTVGFLEKLYSKHILVNLLFTVKNHSIASGRFSLDGVKV